MQSSILNLSNPQNLDKKIKLLEAIKLSGSISKASKLVPISYKLAWEMVESMNNLSKEPIVQRVKGGSGGEVTKLTKADEELIKNYYIIKEKYELFLESISTIKDLKTLEKLAINISARNQLLGKIVHIKNSTLSSDITFKLKSGVELISNITYEAVSDLNLKVGDEIVGIIKASSFYISDKHEREFNSFDGIIESFEVSEGIAKLLVCIEEKDRIWITLKEYIADELKLSVGKSISVFIQPKNILIGR